MNPNFDRTVAVLFPRGTKTTRVKTARLEKGHLILTVPEYSAEGERRTAPTQTKTGAVVREVERLEPYFAGRSGFSQRAQRQYRVFFTDGTQALGLAPIYTWHAVVSADTLDELAAQGV